MQARWASTCATPTSRSARCRAASARRSSIARAVYFGAKVLILDEPTSALGVKQSGVVLRYVAQARDRGLGVIFITHNPHHAFPVGDRFVILNRGSVLGAWRKGEITRDELIKKMSGGAELDALEHELGARCPRSAPHEHRCRARSAAPPRPARRAGASASGVIGFGWLGQAHSRSMLRIPTLFARARLRPGARRLRRHGAGSASTTPSRSFGFGRGTADWREVVDDPAVDVVFIAAPNMLHLELIEAAAAGRQARVLREAGRRHAGADRARRAGRARGGRDHRRRLQLPLARRWCSTPRQLIADGRLGEITNYRGRFFSMYGSDPLGVLSWRFLVDQAGHGVTTDLMSHSVDLAHMLLGPITRVVGTTATFIPERPLPRRRPAPTTAAAAPGDPRGAVTNEDYAGMLCEFAGGARGTFEASRSIVGPESQMAFEVYGTKGALGWNLEKLNELQLYLVEDELHTGYRTVFGGDRFPYHGALRPGQRERRSASRTWS